MPQIYVIYRPADSRKRSQEIIASLKKSYGASNIKYPDFDGYVDVYAIEQEVKKSQYLLVIIGNYWADMVDETGQNLLKSVYDPVHMAIATAISSRKHTIPILIDGADMPSRQRLPREIRAITTLKSITIEKNANISKALNKGLKDIIKRTPMSRFPDFNAQIKLPKRTTTPQQPRLRQSVQPQRDWQHWFKRAVLPTFALAFIAMSIAFMSIPRPIDPPSSQESVPVSLATIAPTSTATTMTRRDSTVTEVSPQIVTPQHEQITVANAGRIQELSREADNLSLSDTFIFSQDQSLFIFASPELKEVQIIDVATNEILRVIEFAPETPIYIALDDTETYLYILSNDGISTWGILE